MNGAGLEMQEKKKRGVKPIQITDEMLRQAEELSGYGMTAKQIAAILGFCERTLRTKTYENEDFAAALARGKAKAAAIVGKALFQRAKDGDVPAIRWWEMTREGRSEKVQAETQISGPDKGPVQVEITDARAKLAELIARRNEAQE